MLKQLSIANLALIDRVTVEFHEGFNAITGETGSGKSVLLKALRLLAGDKGETGLLRAGEEKGWVEALFDCTSLPWVGPLLAQSGIEPDPQGSLLIKREICARGKAKIFLNHQLVQRSLLNSVMGQLFYIVGQHASHALLNSATHRAFVDQYGAIEATVADFANRWNHLQLIENQLHLLQKSEAETLRAIESLRREVAEIEEAHLSVGEEEALFVEYGELSHTEELTALCSELLQLLEGEQAGVLSLLAKGERSIEKLLILQPNLKENGESWKNASLELREVAHAVQRYRERLAADPERSLWINSRLKQLAHLKRKYGRDIAAVLDYRDKACEQLTQLSKSDLKIEELENEVTILKGQLDTMSQQITSKRQKTAALLAEKATGELHQLNMAHAIVEIDITPTVRSSSGDDLIEIFLTPNKGEKRIALRQAASGGELSRLLLALHCLLADKGGEALLLFDEVDANIGGETAALIGAKLRELGASKQVLCITHFPQVASYAHHHLKIAKETTAAGRTLSSIISLDISGKEREFSRMGGFPAKLSS